MSAMANVADPAARAEPLDLRVTAARLHVIADALRARARADLALGETLTRGSDRRAARVHSAEMEGLAARLDAFAKDVVAYCKRAGL